ncbi:MAG: TrkA family potassium uptake protein [Candidatus Omnitrophica bacterium]|nr:TrkA family potassium uptake protein [Candidatus Omnitrophota bacterium]
MYIVIVGGGKVGYFLAQKRYLDKHTVALVEKDKAICEKIASNLDILVINGDWFDPGYLKDAEIERSDVIAAVTGDDEDNLIICQLAKDKFNVSRTVARVNDSKNEHTFNELGIDVPIDSTAIIAKIIEEEVSLADFVTLMTFKRGKLALVRVDLTEESPVINQEVMNVKLPPDSVLLSIIRGEEVIIPKGTTVLQSRDDIIALTLIENEQQLLDALIGKI